MVPFAGWEMLGQYEGDIPDHRAVRTDAGVFDVSHMGELEVEVPGACDLLQAKRRYIQNLLTWQMRRSTVISFVISVLGFGLLVPWWKGFDFFDPLNVLACMMVSLVFIAPMVAATPNEDPDRKRIMRAVMFALAIA